MKKIIFMFLVFFCSIATAATPYENYLRELWEKITYERGIGFQGGFLCQDFNSFFEKATNTLEEGEVALIFFYPKNSGFDHLIEDSFSFIELEDFFNLAEDYGFKIKYCSNHRHLVSFPSRDSMNDYIRNTLHSEPKIREIPLYFPCKMIIAEISL